MQLMENTINSTDTEQYLDIAESIGFHLAKTALWDGDKCNWTGSAADFVNGSFQLVEKTFDTDVYNGAAGIALFLCLLLEQKNDDIISETLEGVMNQIISADSTDRLGNYGYYGGNLGVAANLITIGEKMGRKDWQDKGREKLKQVCEKPIKDFEVDVIGGVAGAIPVLIKLYAKSNDRHVGEALIACGDYLLERAVKTPSTWAWKAIESQPEMTGYSHGAAGIALALLELYRATGNAAYFTGAMMGFNFERLSYNSQIQNWPDLRSLNPGAQQQLPQSSQLTYGESWCHGAPGIALSRLRAWQITNDPAFKQEAELALATTYRNIYNAVTSTAGGSNFSLCHGLAGNADILLEGGRILNNPQYIQVAAEVGKYGIENFHKRDIMWPSGVNDPTGATAGLNETPGLMLGLAGTGYFYLRLALPEKIKCLLLL